MRAYVSFLVVFVSLLILLSLLDLKAQKPDLTKALLVSRTYSVSMNAKEALLEIMRQGAYGGFRAYDESHKVSFCRHCPDSYCNPLPSSNRCDAVLCSKCFREPEARAEAEKGALDGIHRLDAFSAHPDFKINASLPELSAITKPAPLCENGFSLNMLRLDSDISIEVKSESLDARGISRIPKGVAISYADN